MRARFVTQSIDFCNVFCIFLSFAFASVAPPFFDQSSKYVKRHWFYTYLGRPHWAMLDRPREHQKPRNERHLHGNASRKCKMNATLHGNAICVGMVQIGLPKRVPNKCPKPFILNCFGRFLEPHWSTRFGHTKKWSSPSGRQRAAIASAPSIHFCNVF